MRIRTIPRRRWPSATTSRQRPFSTTDTVRTVDLCRLCGFGADSLAPRPAGDYSHRMDPDTTDGGYQPPEICDIESADDREFHVTAGVVGSNDDRN